MSRNFVLDSSALQKGRECVGLRARVDYPSGDPDLGHWLMAPDPHGTHIRVAGHWQHEHRQLPVTIDRGAVPADDPLPRGLATMAVHLFGAADMPPRISGAPLWHKARLHVWLVANPALAYRLELTTTGQQAVLREQRRHGEPWWHRSVELSGWDADPMRALLRQAMDAEHRTTDAVRVRSRPPVLQPMDRLPDPAERALRSMAQT